MRIIKVGAATLNQVPMDWERNINNIKEAIKKATNENVNLLCLPELCITGYGCEDAFISDYVLNESIHQLSWLLNYCKGITITVGLPIKYNKKIYNCIAVISNGSLRGIVPKQHLANNGIHYEKRWFSEWKDKDIVNINLNGYNIPFGDIIFRINGIKFGFEICEDAWVPDRSGISLSKRGVDIILNPSASHFSFNKHEIRKRFIIEGSRAFDCTYVYANLVGNESGRAIYDGDTIIASKGELLANGERFTFENTKLTTANIGVNISQYTDEEVTCSWEVVMDSFTTKPIKQETSMSKIEEFENACCLGLRDYLEKSKSKGFVLSLSGGADSSAVALLIYLMIKKTNKDLSDEEIRSKVNKSLICVYQGTENSSYETLKSANSLSKFIGANFINWEIDDIIYKYKAKVESSIGRLLNWEQDDITLQNIQARVRSPGVWMLANINNFLLLTTSNRSEAAVGYASMDGDTSGGLAPLGGIDKSFILEWLNEKTKDEKYKYGLLDYSELKPTAELRPLFYDKKEGSHHSVQSDEDDLMPYHVLDIIEKLAIRDKISPINIFKQIICDESFSSFKPEIIKDWVVKFFKLWNANQWKRERYAPSFHFDDESLDPKTWCRWPILNSGMKYELLSLEAFFKDKYEDS